MIELSDRIRELRQQLTAAPANGRDAQDRTQRITVTLTPKVVPAEGSVARAALIAGGEVDGER